MEPSTIRDEERNQPEEVQASPHGLGQIEHSSQTTLKQMQYRHLPLHHPVVIS